MKKWTLAVAMVGLTAGLVGCQVAQTTDAGKEAAASASEAAKEAVADVALLDGFTALDSSAMKGVMYNAESKVLSIQFPSGDVYDYANVDQKVYDGLMASNSKGKFYVDEIKDKFEGVKR